MKQLEEVRCREDWIRHFRRESYLKPYNLVLDSIRDYKTTEDGYTEILEVHDTEKWDVPSATATHLTLDVAGNKTHITIWYLDGHTYEHDFTDHDYYLTEQALHEMLKHRITALVPILKDSDIVADLTIKLDDKYECIIRTGTLQHIVYGPIEQDHAHPEITLMENLQDLWEELDNVKR